MKDPKGNLRDLFKADTPYFNPPEELVNKYKKALQKKYDLEKKKLIGFVYKGNAGPGHSSERFLKDEEVALLTEPHEDCTFINFQFEDRNKGESKSGVVSAQSIFDDIYKHGRWVGDAAAVKALLELHGKVVTVPTGFMELSANCAEGDENGDDFVTAIM